MSLQVQGLPPQQFQGLPYITALQIFELPVVFLPQSDLSMQHPQSTQLLPARFPPHGEKDSSCHTKAGPSMTQQSGMVLQRTAVSWRFDPQLGAISKFCDTSNNMPGPIQAL